MKIIFLIMLFIIFNSCLGTKNYTNYTLFRTLPLNEEHLEFVKNLSSQIKVDFWRPPGLVNKPVDMLINPVDKKIFMRSMDENQFYYTTVMDDVQSAFDLQTVKPYVRRKMETFDWKSFFSLNDIYAWMKDLEKSYPNDITVLNLGKTYENKDILGVKLIVNGSKARSAVVFEGGIHAREWISTAFVTYLLDQLVKSIKTPNTDIGKIARTYEFYFIPVVNPDGYDYSMKEDRMWRKNRNGGYGIDINRNFDASFQTTGVSLSKTDETYCGPYAFSEKESQAVQNVANIVKDKLEYYLAFHSYGQFIILPYAYLKQHAANYDEMRDILIKARNKMAEKFETTYTIGTAYETVGYTTSGVSGCWVKKAFKVPYVATFELRDQGKHGFALPPNQILPTCVETMSGVTSILTPKTKEFEKIENVDYQLPFNRDISANHNKQRKHVLDYFVMIVNILFFIIVKFY